MLPNRLIALLQTSDHRQRLRWLYSAILAGVPGEVIFKVAALGRQLSAKSHLSWQQCLNPNTVEGQAFLSLCCLLRTLSLLYVAFWYIIFFVWLF